MPNQHTKRQLNARVSDEAHAIVEAMSRAQGITKSAFLEILLRREASAQGFRVRRQGGRVRVEVPAES